MPLPQKVYLLLFLLLLAGCAPPNSDSSRSDAQKPSAPVESVSAFPDPISPAPPHTLDSTPIPEIAEPTPVTPTGPDWPARYQELIEQYAASFTPPRTGQRVTIELNSGRKLTGTLSDLSPEELVLETTNGRITYPRTALSVRSSRHFFQDVYAVTTARHQAQQEFRTWQAQQATPTPQPQISSPASNPRPPESAPRERKPSTSDDSERMFPIPPHMLRQ